MKTEAVIDAIPVTAPAMQPVAEWLADNQVEVGPIVRRATLSLRQKGRRLPHPQLIKYCTRAVLNEFFPRWARKNKGKLSEVLADSGKSKKELRPFVFALMLISDEQTFRKVSPRFVQTNMARRLKTPLRTADDFAAFAIDKSGRIAGLFLEHFDPSRRTSAVAYLEKTAVSLFLTPAPVDADDIDPASLESYIKNSKRLDSRTILALKLAYMPLLLTLEERKSLRTDYGFKGNLDIRLKKKDIATKLRFPNAAALSRKLYKVCQWCERHAARQEVGGRRRG